MAKAGHPLDATAGPVITNFPIWMAETMRIPALALPDEPPSSVLTLANDPRFKARLVVLLDAASTHWPADLDAGARVGADPGPATKPSVLVLDGVRPKLC